MGQVFHKADHVIAQIAKKPRSNRRQTFWQINPAFGNQGAQGCQRVCRLGGKRCCIKARLAVQTGGFAMALPDQVGLHAHNGITPAHLAARHRFQHKGVGPRFGQFHHQRNGRVQIGGQTGVDNLILALGPSRREGGKIGLQRHGQFIRA